MRRPNIAAIGVCLLILQAESVRCNSGHISWRQPWVSFIFSTASGKINLATVLRYNLDKDFINVILGFSFFLMALFFVYFYYYYYF